MLLKLLNCQIIININSSNQIKFAVNENYEKNFYCMTNKN
jgi:hypothetical protein